MEKTRTCDLRRGGAGRTSGRPAGALLLSALLLAGPAAAEGRAPQPAPERVALFEAACRTYENRARFLPRGSRPDFRAVLADACGPALETLRRGGPGSVPAAVFLERLHGLRETVVQIGLGKIFGRDADPGPGLALSDGALRPLAGVSLTGEYLIAHSMGVFRAQQALGSGTVRQAGAEPRQSGAAAVTGEDG